MLGGENKLKNQNRILVAVCHAYPEIVCFADEASQFWVIGFLK